MLYTKALYDKLGALGFEGACQDRFAKYLRTKMAALGINTDISVPSMLHYWLLSQGYTGANQDMLEKLALDSGFNSHSEQMQSAADFVTRWALNFDGIGIRGVLTNRAINPDGDIDIEWSQSQNSFGIVLSQQIATNGALREFSLYIDVSTVMTLTLGGVQTSFNQTNFRNEGTYRLTLVGTLLNLYKNGVLVTTRSFTRGGAREPTSVTVVGARTNDAIGSYTGYFLGLLYNVKINGTLWPISARNQTVQLPVPDGLGTELITPTVLANPVIKGTQWTYLGDGRWQYAGDGTVNSLRFLPLDQHPVAGLFTLEVESISGGFLRLNPTIGAGFGDRVFSTVGIKRFGYTSGSLPIVIERNTAGEVINCVIKNISFKPLGTSNPMTIANATSANWVEISA